MPFDPNMFRPAMPNPVSQLGNFFQNNQATMMALGGGLLNHRQNANAPWFDVSGVQEGMSSDRERKRVNKTKQELMRRFGLSDEEAEAAARDPVWQRALFTGQSPQEAMPPAEMRSEPMAFYRGGMEDKPGIHKIADKAPSGYYDPSEGTPPQLDAIPGGPGEELPGENAARIGLSMHFLEQVPMLREQIGRGNVTGPIDNIMGRTLSGSDQASVYRKIESGTDALRRMLTGAGMPEGEAAAYTRRYLPDVTDNAESALDKLNQLEGELKYMVEMMMRGRGGVPWEQNNDEPPAGLSHEDWDYMTPEEKALWRGA